MGLRVEQVHVPAAAAAQTVHPAEDLGGHRPQVHPVGDGQVVRPVRRGEGVIGGQVRADACGDRLLARRQVHFSRDQPLPDVETGTLVRVVFPEDRLLVGAAQNHGLVQAETQFRGKEESRRLRDRWR